MPKVRVVLRAYNAEGYQLDLVVMDEVQVRITNARVKGGVYGPLIDPKVFPEMVKFELIVEDLEPTRKP